MTNAPLLEPNSEAKDDQLLVLLFAIYLALIPAGTILIRFGALESGLTMNWDRAFFNTVNALTCTGFRLSAHGLSDFGQMGAIVTYGLMAAGAFLVLSIGGLLVSRILGMAHSRAKLLLAALGLLLIGSAAGAGFLMTPGRPLWPSLFEATGSLTNAGMMIDDPRELFDIRLHAVVLPLAAIGGLGLPVILELFELFIKGKPVSQYTGLVLRLTVLAWLIAFVLLLVVNLQLSLRQNVATSWLYAINSRSLGMDISLPSALPRQTWWTIAILMLIGAAPASTAGGMKLTTLWVLNRTAQRAGGKEVLGRAVGAAIRYVGIFLLCTLALYLMLLGAEPQLSPERLAVISAGTLSTTGLSHDPLTITGFSLYLLSAGMLTGHLLPLFFAWWMKRQGLWDMAIA